MQNVYETVITQSKAIESLLAQLGAEGKGLHEKCTSVEHRLTPEISRLIRKIASIRNKVIHEEVNDSASVQQLVDASETVIPFLEGKVATFRRLDPDEDNAWKGERWRNFKSKQDEYHANRAERENGPDSESRSWKDMSGWEKAGVVGALCVVGVLAIITS